MAPAGRPRGPEHATRSIRLSRALWDALEAAVEARREAGDETTVNAIVKGAVELWLAMDASESRG